MAPNGPSSPPGAVDAPPNFELVVHLSIDSARYTPIVRTVSRVWSVAFEAARSTLWSTKGVDSSLRKQMGDRVRDFFADAIEAMGGAKRAQLALKNEGLRAPDGAEYSVRAISSWAEKKNPKQPAPEVLFAVAELSGLSVDSYVHGDALEAKFSARVDDHEQRVGALETQLWELAAMLGWELEHRPLPEGASLKELMDDLRQRMAERRAEPD